MMNFDPLAELDDPRTSAERLHQLAAEHPESGARIAAHPNCYPELAAWITEQQARRSPAPNSEAQPAPKPRRTVKTIAILAAVVLPLITAVSVTVPLLANLGAVETSAATLKMLEAPNAPTDSFADATVIGEETTRRGEDEWQPGEYQMDWRMPSDAPIDTFPTAMRFDEKNRWWECSESQLEWLGEHAEPFDMFTPEKSFDVTLHNSASDGGALAIGSIRFVGEEVETTPWLYFYCPGGGRGAGGGNQLALIGVDGEEALYGEPLSASGENANPEGSPVVLNLEPGEVAVLTLTRAEHVDPQRSYEGRFVADLMDGSGETVVLAENVRFRRERVPTFGLGVDEHGLVCKTADLSSIDANGNYGRWESRSCTPTEAQEFLREAAASIGR